jgi:vitamin B12/bleomycin/antimicrobial peptide transport system ATP-binding/permease protein
MGVALMATGTVTFDRLTRKRLAQVVQGFLQSDEGGKGRRLAGLLVGLMVVINVLNVMTSYVGRDFMSALERRDPSVFAQQAILYIVMFACSTAAAVFFRFCEERLGLLWRESLTRQLTEAYLKHCLRRHSDTEKVANPDQRIAEDVRAFTTTSLSFALLLLNGTFTVIAFSGVLWSISQTLFVVAVIYAAGGSALAIRLGRPLIGLNFRQSDREANFRSELIHIRDHADEVALTHNEPLFSRRLSQRIGDWASNMRRLIAVNRNLSFFTTGYNLMIQIIPALIVAPLFFSHKVEFGVITQSAGAFAILLGAFSLIVTQFQSISAFAAVIARLSELAGSIERAIDRPVTPIAIREESRRLRFESIELLTADTGVPLIRDLDLVIPERANLLVAGPNVAARQALFHLLAGDWERGSGVLVTPDPGRLMLLPERPYLPTGTLRQILRVEGGDFRVNDLRTRQALRLLDLDDVVVRVGGLDVVRDWGDCLSLAEQQLFSCVRAIAANPDFIVIDRPGTTLKNPELEEVLTAFRKMGQGSVILSGTGEASALFDALLTIEMDGTWSYVPQIRAVKEELIEPSEPDDSQRVDRQIVPIVMKQGDSGDKGKPDFDSAAG